MYRHLSEALSAHVGPGELGPEDTLLGDESDRLQEMAHYMHIRGLQVESPAQVLATDPTSILTPREKEALLIYAKEYYERFSTLPSNDPSFCAFLGDNPSHSLTWSATSGRIPCFRTRAGFTWFYSKRRWMFWREQLTALGFPVFDEVSASMGCPPLPLEGIPSMARFAGNCMHLVNASMVLLTALCCVKAR